MPPQKRFARGEELDINFKPSSAVASVAPTGALTPVPAGSKDSGGPFLMVTTRNQAEGCAATAVYSSRG